MAFVPLCMKGLILIKILSLYDIEKDIKMNDMKEVTSAIIYQPANHYNPAGLFSEEIFGQTEDERTYRCGYIKLPIHVFNPGVAKTIIGRSGGPVDPHADGSAICDKPPFHRLFPRYRPLEDDTPTGLCRRSAIRSSTPGT